MAQQMGDRRLREDEAGEAEMGLFSGILSLCTIEI